MSSEKEKAVSIILVAITILALLGITLHLRRAGPGRPLTYDVELEDQKLLMARSPTGLEVFVPTGKPRRSNVMIVVDRRFRTQVSNLGPGITQVPRSSFKGEHGEPMPDDYVITNATVSFGENPEYTISFHWRGARKGDCAKQPARGEGE
jgi:hypothetical protein